MADASLDNCGNCQYWDQDDEDGMSDEDLEEGRGVCQIMSYPEDYGDQRIAFTDDSPVVTSPEFHCTLYKVRK